MYKLDSWLMVWTKAWYPRTWDKITSKPKQTKEGLRPGQRSKEFGITVIMNSIVTENSILRVKMNSDDPVTFNGDFNKWL